MVKLKGEARLERTGARRRQILRAALDVFSRKGFHGATTREIATAAGLAEGTIYLYFPSKQDVLKGVFTLIADEAQAAIPAFPDAQTGDDAAFLTALIRDRVRALARYAPLFRLVAHEADLNQDLRAEFFTRLHGPFVSKFEVYLAARISRGTFRPVNTTLAASICFRMIMSYLMTQYVLELDRAIVTGRHHEDEYVAEMVSLILHGLTARSALP